MTDITNTHERLKQKCAERNQESDAYINQHYGNSIGPRRRYRWEVRGGQIVLVEL